MPRFQKGSQEAKDWAKKMRESRGSKKETVGKGMAPPSRTSQANPKAEIVGSVSGMGMAPPSRTSQANPKAEIVGSVSGMGLGMGCVECDKCSGMGILGGGKRKGGDMETITEGVSQMSTEPRRRVVARPPRPQVDYLTNLPDDVFREVIANIGQASGVRDLQALATTSKMNSVKRKILNDTIRELEQRYYTSPPSSPREPRMPTPPLRRRRQSMQTSPLAFPVMDDAMEIAPLSLPMSAMDWGFEVEDIDGEGLYMGIAGRGLMGSGLINLPIDVFREIVSKLDKDSTIQLLKTAMPSSEHTAILMQHLDTFPPEPPPPLAPRVAQRKKIAGRGGGASKVHPSGKPRTSYPKIKKNGTLPTGLSQKEIDAFNSIYSQLGDATLEEVKSDLESEAKRLADGLAGHPYDVGMNLALQKRLMELKR
jgi:hypothetical protein